MLYTWNSFREVRIPGTQFKTQEPCSFGIDSSFIWDIVHTAHMTSWQMGEMRDIMLKDLREVSRERKWINLLLPQRLMENIRALLSKTHCKKDVAKLLNKVTQLWGDFLIYAQILSPGVAGQTLPSGVNQISHLICKCPDCTFLGFNSLSLSPPGNDTS